MKSNGIEVLSDLRRENIVDQVTGQLRNAILDGTIQPGTRLVQEQVAARFNVSRTPVREAFKVLVNEGLLEKTRSSNTADVVSLKGEDAREYYEIREVVDGLASRLAATHRSPKALRKLRSLATDIDRSTHPFSTDRFLVAHTAFHLAVLEASGNSRLRQFEIVVRISAQMLYPQLKSDEKRMRASALEHAAIVDAIEAGDAARSETLARKHIRAATNRWLRETTS